MNDSYSNPQTSTSESKWISCEKNVAFKLRIETTVAVELKKKKIPTANEHRDLNVMKQKQKKKSCFLEKCLALWLVCLAVYFLCAFACELVFTLFSISECPMLTVRPNPPQARNTTILNLHHAVRRTIEFSYTTAHVMEAMKRTFKNLRFVRSHAGVYDSGSFSFCLSLFLGVTRDSSDVEPSVVSAKLVKKKKYWHRYKSIRTKIKFKNTWLKTYWILKVLQLVETQSFCLKIPPPSPNVGVGLRRSLGSSGSTWNMSKLDVAGYSQGCRLKYSLT